MNQILLIEDDKAMSNGILMALQTEKVQITQCFTIQSAREHLLENAYDLLIIDVNLPDGNGLELMCDIKKNHNQPVLLLTANDMETDIVAGLELGADDYITKPFSLAVLRARVNTQLRKQTIYHSNRFVQDAFTFDFDQMVFQMDGQTIELSKTEQKLLRLLVENQGNTLERNLLVDRLWTDGADYVDENALSVTVKRLRDKIEKVPNKPQYIKTVYGIGYTWAVN